MKKVKKQKGITLIALIITIIVLLILAGIVISALSGENGILKRAGQASEETKKAQYKELIELLISEKIIDVSKEPTDQKMFIEIVKEGIQENYTQWVESIIICDDELNEVDSEKGTKLVVDTKDGYQIIVNIDNALKIGSVEGVIKGKPEKWTVSFDLNGGRGTQPEQIKVRKKALVQLPLGEDFNKTDYKFVGWSTQINGERIQEEKYRPQGDITLYAVWSEDTVGVTLNANGETQEKLYNVIRGRDFLIPSPFTKEGYELVGWSETSDGEVKYGIGETIKVTEDIVLYAKWKGKISIALSVTNENNVATTDLTSGTKVNISVISPTAEINNLNIKIGNVTVFNQSQSGNTLSKSISINELMNLTSFTFFETYDITATATNKEGGIATDTKKAGVISYIIRNMNDLKAFSDTTNGGYNFSGKTVYLIADLNASGWNINPIGSNADLAFNRCI